MEKLAKYVSSFKKFNIKYNIMASIKWPIILLKSYLRYDCKTME